MKDSLLSLPLSLSLGAEVADEQMSNEDAISLKDIIPETNICFVSLMLTNWPLLMKST